MTSGGGSSVMNSQDSHTQRDEEELERRFRYPSTHWLGSNFSRLATISCCLLGIQFCWSVEFAYGSNYLISLGMAKSQVSLVWLAGPISGLIMQPLVGVWSDQCTSPMGRRRPFMIVATGMVLFSLFTIGWTVEFVESLGGKPSEAKYFAVMSFIILDFAINAVQACARALIVDILPGPMQEIGNAWASRMIGLGNVFGYLMGYLDLVKILPFFGDKQLKVLSVIGAISLLLTVTITCYCVIEKRIYNSDLEDYDLNPIQKTIKSLLTIFKTMFNLPGPIAKVCNTQFFSWMGWFPFMFYATLWVSEIEFDGKPPIDETLGGNDSVGDSTRTGSFALVIFSVVSLISSFVLPLIVKNKNNSNESNNANNSRYSKYLLSLPQWFTLTLAMYGICMLCTTFIWTVTGATILIALCGIPWSVSMWAPFSLIAEHLRNQNLEHGQSAQTEEYRRLTDIVTEENENDRDDDTVPLGAQIPTTNYISRRANNPSDPPPRYSGTFDEDQPLTQSNDHVEEVQPPKSVGDAGMILGIHNIYIVIPQLIISLVGSIIFYIYEATKPNGSSGGISAILKLAGVLSLVSSFVSLSIWKNKHT